MCHQWLIFFCQIIVLKINTVALSWRYKHKHNGVEGINTGLNMDKEGNTQYHSNHPFILPNYPPHGNTRLFKIHLGSVPWYSKQQQQDTQSESQFHWCYSTGLLSSFCCWTLTVLHQKEKCEGQENYEVFLYFRWIGFSFWILINVQQWTVPVWKLSGCFYCFQFSDHQSKIHRCSIYKYIK